MNSKGFNVTGIDLSEKMINIAKNKFPTIDFRVADLTDIEFESEKFNVVVLLYSLIHIPKKDIKIILTKFYKMLRKGGLIYIALQYGKSEEVFIDALYNPKEKMFLNVFSYEGIETILLNIGFSIIKQHERKSKSWELNYTKLHIIAQKQ